jgi:hypothetical protein
MVSSSPLNFKHLHADTIAQVKQRADLVTVISEHIVLRKSGKDYMGLCPFHEEKSPSFSVSPTKQLYYCFGCTAGGDAIKFLMEIGRNSFEEVVTSLADRYNIFIPEIVPQNSQNPVKECRVSVSPTESTGLARLPNRPTDIPQRNQRQKDTEIIYRYGDQRWVQRLETPDPTKPKGYSKITLPWHINEQGEAVNKKGTHPWQPYRLDEVMQYASGKWSLAVEGENCVEAARELELVSLTLPGGSWTEADCQSAMRQCKNAAVAGILYWPDNDEVGHKKAQKMSQAAAQAGVPFIQLDPLAIWEDMPDAGDIVDWVKWGMEQGWNKDDFIQRLEASLHHSVNQANAARIEEQRRNDPDERLKLEISLYAKESDLFKKKRLRGRICSNYRISKQDLEELVEELERSHSTPKKTSYSASEFFAQETAALEWIVPGLLPVGETALLASIAKVGKTGLITDIIHAVLAGETVVGEQVGVKGKVLFITSDESPRTTRRRLRARGIDLLAEQDNLRIMPHLDISKLNELEAELEDFQPQLVVIDSLTTICLSLGISEKDPEFARYIYKLKDLLGRYNAAGIITHHENKDSLAKGINKISGSARIPAAVWGIWQLEPVNPNDKQSPLRRLNVQPREGEPTVLSLRINPKDLWASQGIYEFLGEFGDETGEKRSHGERVLALLAKYSPKGLTFKEIDEQVRAGRTLYSVLDRLEDRQTITKRRSVMNPRLWVYALPDFSGDSPPPSDDHNRIAEVIESLDTQPTESIQQVFSTNSASIQHSPAETEVLNRQDVEPVGNLVDIQQTELSVGGEGETPLAECQTELFEQRLNGDFVAVASAQTEQLDLQESVDDLWMSEENLQSMANDLSGCSGKEELAQLRQCWSPEAMNVACKRLAPEKHEQIRQWVIELNSQDS